MTNAIANAFGKMLGKDSVEDSIHSVDEPRVDRREVGKIIKLHPSGWGFISCHEIKFTRIFFHWTSLRQDTLNFAYVTVGMMAEFTPIEVEGKGTRAIKIKILPQDELTIEQQEHQSDSADIEL